METSTAALKSPCLLTESQKTTPLHKRRKCSWTVVMLIGSWTALSFCRLFIAVVGRANQALPGLTPARDKESLASRTFLVGGQGLLP